MKIERGTLANGEAHPSAHDALDYLKGIGIEKLTLYLESFSSCAIEGNRLGEICSETLNRFLNSQPVSDRYIMGLAWSIRNMEDSQHKKKKIKGDVRKYRKMSEKCP